MRGFTSSLGFRLTMASYLVVAVFMTVAGYTVYRVSKDSIKLGAMTAIGEMAEDLRPAVGRGAPVPELGDLLLRRKAQRMGAAWLMDLEGRLLYTTDPHFREEFVEGGKNFGNVVASLQFASPRRSGQGSAREKLVEIARKYEEGFGSYRQFGTERVLAFRTLPQAGLLVGLDEPVSTANSELDRIKKYISYTGLVSALLIMAFNLLSIRIIIRPYYRQLEDLNESLQTANERLEDVNAQLTDSNRNLTVLYEVGLGMRHSLALRDILALIVNGAHGVLGVDRIAVFVPTADGRSLACHAAVGGTVEPSPELRVPADPTGGALGTAFARKETVRVDAEGKMAPGLRLPPPLADDPFLRSRAFVVVPLVVKDRAVGVIAADNRQRRTPITEAQVALLGIFANQAAVAVDNARLYDQLRHKIAELDARVDQLSVMHQIGNSMQRAITREEALGFIMRGIFEGVGFTEVVLALVDSEREALRGEVSLGVDKEAAEALRIPLAEEENLLVLASARKAPVGIAHFAEEELLAILRAPLAGGAYREHVGSELEGARTAVLAVPLIAREEVVGVVAVARRQPPVVRRGEVELLLLYANTAGLTVERAELYARLQHSLESLEVTDAVSRLATNRSGLQRTGEELARCAAAGAPFGALMIGVDGLKEYNERFGPEAGDRALAEIGEVVKASLRPEDVAFRFGGRILAAGMPGADAARALAAAGRIHGEVRRHRFQGEGGARDQRLTVSVAAGSQPAAGAAPGEVYTRLLGHLHRAEAGGGDQVLAAEG